MSKIRTSSGILLTLLLVCVIASAFDTQSAKAAGTITIRADGSIDPPTAPITTADYITYIMTGDVSSTGDGIVLQRDHMILNGGGYTISGEYPYVGIDVSCLYATIKNVKITGGYAAGITVWGLHGNLSGNTIIGSRFGVWPSGSFCEVVGNNISEIEFDGLHLEDTATNKVHENNITNCQTGIRLTRSNYNNISDNNIKENTWGIYLSSSSNNIIYHNNFKGNGQQASSSSPAYANAWDNGYPSGGNHWSDYVGTDILKGINQNIPGSDGIGDLPYVIDAGNRDNYPLMKPSPWDLHDIAITGTTTSCGIVAQGHDVSIQVTIFNYGGDTETFNVTIFADETEVGRIDNLNLESRNSTVITFAWNTSGFVGGNYTISAAIDNVTGEIDFSDNTFVDGNVVVTILGDINGDFKCDGRDIAVVAKAFNTKPGDPLWNPNADINGDGKVDGRDIAIISKYFNTHYP